jgi:hypothetical protein
MAKTPTGGATTRIDPALQFDMRRGAIEPLPVKALASGDVGRDTT